MDSGGLGSQCGSWASQLYKPHCWRQSCPALAKCVCKIQETCVLNGWHEARGNVLQCICSKRGNGNFPFYEIINIMTRARKGSLTFLFLKWLFQNHHFCMSPAKTQKNNAHTRLSYRIGREVYMGLRVIFLKSVTHIICYRKFIQYKANIFKLSRFVTLSTFKW